jgi:hypothetical protein
MTQSYNLSQLANNLNTAGQLDATDGLVNAVPAANGGTGLAVYNVGDLVYASGTTTLAKLSDVAVGNALISGGVGSAPGYGKVGLTTHVSGTLPVANGGTGTATLALNNVLLGNTTSAVQTIAPGASGNALISDGTTWSSSAVPTTPLNIQVFTSSGTFTVPAGITRVKVWAYGAGGGGGGGSGTGGAANGGSGGAGGLGSAFITGLTPGAAITVTIGTGGNGGVGANSGQTSGTAGTNTSFGGAVTATGGGGGLFASGGVAGASGAAGTFSTTGQIINNPRTQSNATGGGGNGSSGTNTGIGLGGSGGGGMSGGGGGSPGTGGTIGVAGSSFGAGANGNAGSTTIGGAGGGTQAGTGGVTNTHGGGGGGGTGGMVIEW